NLNELKLRISKRTQLTSIGTAGIQIERAVDPAELRYHIMAVDNVGDRRLGPRAAIGWKMPPGRPISPQRPPGGGIALHFAIEADGGGLAVPGADHMISYASMSNDQPSGIQDQVAGNLLEKLAGSALQRLAPARR